MFLSLRIFTSRDMISDRSLSLRRIESSSRTCCLSCTLASMPLAAMNPSLSGSLRSPASWISSGAPGDSSTICLSCISIFLRQASTSSVLEGHSVWSCSTLATRNGVLLVYSRIRNLARPFRLSLITSPGNRYSFTIPAAVPTSNRSPGSAGEASGFLTATRPAILFPTTASSIRLI